MLQHATASPSTTKSRSGRLVFLDVLRGIAAIAVFVVHAGANNSDAFARARLTWFDLGAFGVTLFFLCSGFIIPVSLERSGSLRQFWVNRVCRLYPLYWCSVLLVVICAAAGLGKASDTITNFGQPDSVASLAPSAVLANLTMFQTFMVVPHVLGLYWTLTFEMVFYLMLSGFFLLKLSQHTLPLAFGMLAAAITVEIILPWTTGFESGHASISNYATMFVGTALYRLWSGSVSKRALQPVMVLTVMMLLGTLVQLMPNSFELTLNRGLANVAAYSVFGIGLVFAQREVAWRSQLAQGLGRAGQYLGQISYSLYLMHPFVLLLVPRVGNLFVSIVIWLLALIVVSSVTYRCVEVPGIQVGRYLNRSGRPQRQPAEVNAQPI